jgi:GNAT superfamily N-acetyltransferase
VGRAAEGAEAEIGVIAIREPGEAELPLCRILLPEVAADPAGREFRLAFRESDGKLAGALSYRDAGAALSQLRLHVVPAYRRRGIGTKLVEYAAGQARTLGRGRLRAEADLHSETEAEAFLNARGFRRLGTITFVEIGVEDIRAFSSAYQERKAVELPAGFRFVELSKAPQDEIARLYAEHIAHLDAVAGFRDLLKLERANASLALMAGEKVAGFVVARLENRVLHTAAWVVAPEFREKNLGVALLVEHGKRLRGQVDRQRVEFTEKSMVTPRMLTVPGCVVTRIVGGFEREVAA